MTHYDVDYSAIEGDAKRDAAVRDIREYLGEERYRIVCQYFVLMQEPLSLDEMSLALMMAGVQGYPVQAWRETLWPEVRE